MRYDGNRINKLWNLANLHLKSSLPTKLASDGLDQGASCFQAPDSLLSNEDKNVNITGILEWFDEPDCINRLSTQWMASRAKDACHAWRSYLVAACISLSYACIGAPPVCLGSKMPTMLWNCEQFFLAGAHRIVLPCFQHISAGWPELPPLFLNSACEPAVLNLFLVTNTLLPSRKLHLCTYAWSFTSRLSGSMTTWTPSRACPPQCLQFLFKRPPLNKESGHAFVNTWAPQGLHLDRQWCLWYNARFTLTLWSQASPREEAKKISPGYLWKVPSQEYFLHGPGRRFIN